MNICPNKIYIVANTNEEKYLESLNKAVFTLRGNGFLVSMADEVARRIKFTQSSSFGESECDYIITLGGDGTFLSGCQLAIMHDKPVCGINFGHAGFLCAFKKEEISLVTPESLLKKRIEEQMVLETEHQGNRFYAVNDFIIGKDNFGGSIRLDAVIDGKEERSLKGDGLVIATRVGSTAYNKTCGGAVLERDSHLIVITPILKNSGTLESMTLSDESVIEVFNTNPKYGASVFADGRTVGRLEGVLKVSKSPKTVKIVVR